MVDNNIPRQQEERDSNNDRLEQNGDDDEFPNQVISAPSLSSQQKLDEGLDNNSDSNNTTDRNAEEENSDRAHIFTDHSTVFSVNKNHNRIPRSFRYLPDALTLDDTEFCTKIELTADYQGSFILSASDEFYGSARNLIKTVIGSKSLTTRFPRENEEDGEQDGWLVRRHEKKAHAKIQLGANGMASGVDIDTTGYIQCAPLSAALYGRLRDHPGRWTRILPSVALKPNSHNFFETRHNTDIYDQILVTMTPGGGIHRLRVFGDVVPPVLPLDITINLSSTIYGSQIIHKPHNILRRDVPNIILGRSDSSLDGWICPRNNYNSKDKPQYTIIKLALEGIIDRIVIDTTHFIGNAPKSIIAQGCSIIAREEADPNTLFDDAYWVNLIDSQDPFHNNIYPNMLHVVPCIYREPVTHVRVLPIPDGGIQQMLFKGRIQQRGNIPTAYDIPTYYK